MVISSESAVVRHRRNVVDALARARELRADLERLDRLLGRAFPEVGTWLPFAVSDQEAVVDRLSGVLDDLDGKDTQ
ncbi:hypothetical protein SAMN04487820_111216 [Actinopolyspora mzabensis]|uniref:Uncharacterized protein n=1 Tax=Actinopolyspora mzabensis TaxID=995066 RepID=A0A1G9EA17_ACTMZ|nr:hypothetical protein SAMN04487820_111216 [Actinopolyspora mzabensis]